MKTTGIFTLLFATGSLAAGITLSTEKNGAGESHQFTIDRFQYNLADYGLDKNVSWTSTDSSPATSCSLWSEVGCQGTSFLIKKVAAAGGATGYNLADFGFDKQAASLCCGA